MNCTKGQKKCNYHAICKLFGKREVTGKSFLLLLLLLMSDSSQLFFPPPPSHKAPVSPCKTSLLSVSPLCHHHWLKVIATSTVITVKMIISHHHQSPNIFLGSVKPNTLLSFSCSSATKLKGIGTLQYENGVREREEKPYRC